MSSNQAVIVDVTMLTIHCMIVYLFSDNPGECAVCTMSSGGGIICTECGRMYALNACQGLCPVILSFLYKLITNKKDEYY